MIQALEVTRVEPIWDFCHYGYPDDADPFSTGFADRFAEYCFAAARYVTSRLHSDWGPYFAPMNEITYFAQVRDLIEFAAARYGRPIFVSETSGLRDGRDEWLDDIMQSLAALYDGIDLHGVCLYPAVDMPDWNDGTWLHNGIADLIPADGDLLRVPDLAYVARIREWQERLRQPARVNEAVMSSPTDLSGALAAAERLKSEGDVDWH